MLNKHSAQLRNRDSTCQQACIWLVRRRRGGGQAQRAQSGLIWVRGQSGSACMLAAEMWRAGTALHMRNGPTLRFGQVAAASAPSLPSRPINKKDHTAHAYALYLVLCVRTGGRG